jgi:hypothetical protein
MHPPLPAGQMDKDGSGEIDRKEFYTACVGFGIAIRPQSVNLIWPVFDKSGDGLISIDELSLFLQVRGALQPPSRGRRGRAPLQSRRPRCRADDRAAEQTTALQSRRPRSDSRKRTRTHARSHEHPHEHSSHEPRTNAAQCARCGLDASASARIALLARPLAWSQSVPHLG